MWWDQFQMEEMEECQENDEVEREMGEEEKRKPHDENPRFLLLTWFDAGVVVNKLLVYNFVNYS